MGVDLSIIILHKVCKYLQKMNYVHFMVGNAGKLCYNSDVCDV